MSRCRLGQVAAPVHAGEVHVLFVGAADEIRKVRRGVIDVGLAGKPDGADRAEVPAGGLADPLRARHAQGIGHAGHFLRFDGIELVVAAQDECHHAAIAPVHQQSLHAARGGLRGSSPVRRWCGHSASIPWPGVACRRARRCRRNARRGLDVRRIVIAVRECDGILARVGENVKFLRYAAADAAAVRLHGAEFEAHAGKNAGIRVEHGPVALREARLIDVKRVGVLHEELTGAHHAEARANLIAELRLNLVEIDRQLLVAAQLPTRNVGDDFLVRRSVGEFAFVTILEAQQLRSVLAPATRFLPQLGRLHRRHPQFQRAGPIHLLADDAFDFVQRAKTDRQPRVQAGGQAADHAGAQHELVTDDFRLGGHFLEGRDGVLG